MVAGEHAVPPLAHLGAARGIGRGVVGGMGVPPGQKGAGIPQVLRRVGQQLVQPPLPRLLQNGQFCAQRLLGRLAGPARRGAADADVVVFQHGVQQVVGPAAAGVEQRGLKLGGCGDKFRRTAACRAQHGRIFADDRSAKSPRKMTSPRRRRSSCSSFISVLPPKITEITASRARYQYTLPARPPQAQMLPKCVIFTKSVDIDRILQYIHCINSNAVTGTSTPQHRPQRAAGQVQGSGQGCG